MGVGVCDKTRFSNVLGLFLRFVMKGVPSLLSKPPGPILYSDRFSHCFPIREAAVTFSLHGKHFTSARNSRARSTSDQSRHVCPAVRKREHVI